MGANIVLVGLGPHAKRIYIKCIANNKRKPVLIIDLESKKDDILEYLKENNLDAETYFIREEYRNSLELSQEDQKNIAEILQRKQVTHAIISTEPKAHYMYICYFLKHNIHILVDKPLTAPIDVITDPTQAKRIEEDYQQIKKLYLEARKSKTILQVQCQRRWHNGYRFVHKLASDIVKKYNIPITAIQITHCDGMWNMPDEFVTRENHPYKYGYGKLFHSGYHFVDLLSWFESINDEIEEKKANNVELYAASVKPNDFMEIINKQDYQNIFHDNKFDPIFNDQEQYHFEKYGELDLYSILQFKHNDKVISTAIINLMQDGFSRRSWNELPYDTYKGNGRVRHEYMNLEIGPLMNIQVHSYQSKEIKDRIKGGTDVGEVEHFDVFVFRNVDLIGGKPFEKYTLNELFGGQEQMQGYNEKAREVCFSEFIEEKVEGDPILEHELGIRLLEKEYEALCNKYHGETGCLSFTI